MAATATTTTVSPATISTRPVWAKYLVGAGIALAAVAAYVGGDYPHLGFGLMAASTGINAFAAYLGWSKT